jgi:hypothetical protein
MRTFWVAVVSAAVLASTVQPATAAGAATGTDVGDHRVRIDFDPGTAPCLFENAQPLGEEYASLGVHFSGPSATEGGAILNQCGRFGVRARSGQEFLAFSAGTYALVPETITFDQPVTRVALYVANGSKHESTYKLVAMRDGAVIGRTVVVARSTSYTGLGIRGHRGIDSVVLTASTPDQSFVVDDLSFTPMG